MIDKENVISIKKIRMVYILWGVAILIIIMSLFFSGYVASTMFFIGVLILLLSFMAHHKYIKCGHCEYVVPFRHIKWDNGPSYCQVCGSKFKYI